MDEAAFRELIVGQRRGFLPSVGRGALQSLSLFYGGAVRARNRAYDVRLLRAQRAAVPVVSVGNITAGGTGKTPFVAWLAGWFRQRNMRVALLSRGYRALPGAVNDEKLVLDRLCPGVPHWQSPDRVASARAACAEHGAQVLILDDGFQHRRLARDLEIVLIDALNPWGYGYLLPRGLLREPLSGLRRADVIVLTRVDQCSDTARQEILTRIRAIHPRADVVEAAYPPQALVNAAGESQPLDALAAAPVAAFCGIGNPSAFRQMLTERGLAAESFTPFPDHHHYTADELERLGHSAWQAGAAVILTTEKDLVKINRTDLGGCPLWAVRIGTELRSGREALERRLEALAAVRAGSGHSS